MKEVNKKSKSFFSRPEGKVGGVFGMALLGLLGFVVVSNLAFIAAALSSLVGIVISVLVLAAIVYMLVDSKTRNLIWYMYKSAMRFITGIFIQIDPIGIIESYVDDLKNNLKKMGKQIGILRGQMRKLESEIEKNKRQVETNMQLASKAKEKGKDKIMVLKVRKAGRLKESNLKLSDLHKKMEVMYRVLCKMYENSEILLEDIQDEVSVRKKEREAIRAGYGAMQSARNIISGNKDRKEMFDQAMEAIADDIGNKVGEMERFMEISENFMDSIDLQNGVYEEQGLDMLSKWEKEGTSFLLGEEKKELIKEANSDKQTIDLDAPIGGKRKEGQKGQYTDLFDF